METVAFDEEKHEYTISGGKVPSVTTVLPDIPEHLKYQQWFIDKTNLGIEAHRFAEQINNCVLAGIDVPKKDERPYCAAYLNFLSVRQPKIIESEMKIFHPLYRYAGTLDIACVLMGKKTILDIKTTTVIKPAAWLQTAAYLMAYNYDNPQDRAVRRGVIQLLPTGKFRLQLFPMKNLDYDFNVFLCKLKSYQWDLKYNT